MAQRKSSQNNRKQEASRSSGSIQIIIAAAICLFLELCLFHVFGKVGEWVRYGLMGVFGLAAYIFPIGVFILLAVLIFAKSNQNRKIVSGVILFLFLSAFLHMVSFAGFEDYSVASYFTDCAAEAKGGGIIGGLIALGLTKAVSLVGAYIVTILVILVCLLLICEIPFGRIFRSLRSGRDEDDYDYEEEEPDKVVRSSKKSRGRDRYEEPDYDDYPETRSRNRMWEDDYQSPRRRRSADSDELVYETTNEDGVVIRIVNSKRKPYQRPRTKLKRARNKAMPLRDGTTQTARSQNKGVGVGANIDLRAYPENVDEIREITTHDLEQEAVSPSAVKPAAQAKETAVPGQEPPSAEILAVSDKKKKERRDQHKPSSKITSETTMTAEKKGGKNLPSDVAVKHVSPVKQTSKGDYVYPPMSLLAQRKGKGRNTNDAELDRIARNLETILANFGVGAKVIDRQVGPTVTRYELQPDMGTRVNKFTSLADDLKLNLAVSDIRIEAPIPGRAAVGIEIPNKEKETVLMRDLLEASDLINHKSKIAFAAGVDISGDVVVADIAKMPHLLVAGTTGSGKSTFINTILMAILYRAKPSEVGLIIIDPKKIEFGVYSGIPHLVKDVVTDPGQAVSTLRWAVNEMTNRYQRMQLSGVRDFKNYNEKFDKGTLSKEEENPKRMPQIVIVIDELADLMMVASKEAEALICRLAQLARAAGIHLIIATQRPSVDVVTGLIKANIPARVALLVASQVDSRTIIDMKGAEELLGYGDMLFYPTGYSKPVRVQGAFVSDDEVANVVGFLKKNKTEDYFAEEAAQIAEYMNNAETGQMDFGGESAKPNNSQDEYLYEAGKLCIEMGKASSSMLQRHFSVGFNRAAKIIDQLTEMGAISQPNGAKPREILVDLYTFEEMFQSKAE